MYDLNVQYDCIRRLSFRKYVKVWLLKSWAFVSIFCFVTVVLRLSYCYQRKSKAIFWWEIATAWKIHPLPIYLFLGGQDCV